MHSASVNALVVHNGAIYSASGDKTVRATHVQVSDLFLE